GATCRSSTARSASRRRSRRPSRPSTPTARSRGRSPSAPSQRPTAGCSSSRAANRTSPASSSSTSSTSRRWSAGSPAFATWTARRRRASRLCTQRPGTPLPAGSTCTAARDRRRSGGLDRRERPGTVEDLGPGPVQPHREVPALHDRKQVRMVVVTTEVDRDRPVLVPHGREVVDAVGAAVVRLEVAVRVVDGDRPEAVYRDVPHGQLVLADGFAGFDADVRRLPVGQTAPAGSGPEQVTDRVDIALRPERVGEAAHAFGELEQRLARGVEADGVEVRQLEGPGGARIDRETLLKRVDRGDVVCIARIDENTHGDRDPGRVELL